MKGQEFKAKIIIFLSIIFLCFAVFSCDSTGIPPDIPTGVRAKSGDEGVRIGWDWGLFQESYNVYMANSSGVSKTNYEYKFEDIVERNCTILNLTNDETCYFVVTAKNRYGIESMESTEVSATPFSPQFETEPNNDITHADSFVFDNSLIGQLFQNQVVNMECLKLLENRYVALGSVL